MVVRGPFDKVFSPGLRKNFISEFINEPIYPGKIFKMTGLNETVLGVDMGNILGAMSNQQYNQQLANQSSFLNALAQQQKSYEEYQSQMMNVFNHQQQQAQPKVYPYLKSPYQTKIDYYKDMFRGEAIFDYDRDALRMKTGELIPISALENGYSPPNSNLQWLDNQVSKVRKYAYAK